MITYKDMSFCDSMDKAHPLCGGCARLLTKEVLEGGKKAGLPVAQFMLAPDPKGECKLYLKKR